MDAAAGRTIGQGLVAKLKAGAYDQMTNPAQFAEAVTRDLRAVNGDLHLGLRFSRTPAAIVLVAAIVLPTILPLLPPEVTVRYGSVLGMIQRPERGQSSPLPHLLVDRTGWESGVEDVARVYRSLPADDQSKAVFFAPSYGQAGALEFFGPRLGLPDRVIGSHNSYWHWSVGRTNADVVIAVDPDPEILRELFSDVWQAGASRCEYCMTWRRDEAIWVGRRSTGPLGRVWARMRFYI